MAKHKPKPWQKVERGKEAQTATGIDAQGKKAIKRNPEQRYSLNERNLNAL